MKPELKKKYIQCIVALLIVCILVVFDQYTKWLAMTHLKNQDSIVIWKDVFQLTYLENRGAAFGLLQGRQLFFSISTLFILVVVTILFFRLPSKKRYFPLQVCAILAVAGALGNFIDRIRLKYVIDFFYFKWIDFPIFNMADIYVVVATIFFAILILFYYKEDEFGDILHR